VRITIADQHCACRSRAARPDVVQIQPIWLSIDLERDS
jgi:hypothetical protein